MKILFTLGSYVFRLSLNLSFKSRVGFYLILMLSIIAPVFDLLFFKMLAEAFTDSDRIIDGAALIVFVGQIVVLLILSNGLKYITKVQRLNYVSKMVEIIGLRTNEAIGGGANWLRMVLLEFFNSVTAIFHVFTIGACSFVLSPVLGCFLLATIFISNVVINCFFRRETFNQRKLYYNKLVNLRKKGELTVLSRVKSTELGAVIVNLVFLFFFIVLLFSLATGNVSNEYGLIFLFLVRFVATSQGLLLSSLMRLSRGWAQVQPKMSYLAGQL